MNDLKENLSISGFRLLEEIFVDFSTKMRHSRWYNWEKLVSTSPKAAIRLFDKGIKTMSTQSAFILEICHMLFSPFNFVYRELLLLYPFFFLLTIISLYFPLILVHYICFAGHFLLSFWFLFILTYFSCSLCGARALPFRHYIHVVLPFSLFFLSGLSAAYFSTLSFFPHSLILSFTKSLSASLLLATSLVFFSGLFARCRSACLQFRLLIYTLMMRSLVLFLFSPLSIYVHHCGGTLRLIVSFSLSYSPFWLFSPARTFRSHVEWYFPSFLSFIWPSFSFAWIEGLFPRLVKNLAGPKQLPNGNASRAS